MSFSRESTAEFDINLADNNNIILRVSKKKFVQFITLKMSLVMYYNKSHDRGAMTKKCLEVPQSTKKPHEFSTS